MMRKVARIYILNENVFIINKLENIPKFEESYSQFGQDAFIMNKFFNIKSNGYFVDIGANHPINCNNTYLFEKRGWTGVAIDPQTMFNELWIKNRQTKLLNYVIGDDDKEINFVEGGIENHGLSGVEGFNKLKDKRQNIVKKNQKLLGTILIENNINRIDLLSIDVEGYELTILNNIDFNKIDINVIVIENNIGFTWLPIIGKYIGSELGNNKIRRLLINNGYNQVARIMCDDIFIKK